jgi:predicted transcriptional regulator of viral defense system
METTLRTLGPAEAKVVLSFREQGRDVVETGDIIRLLASEQTSRKVIRNLVRKGWLTRLGGGRYMLLPPEWGAETTGENNPLAVASAVVKESYIGWWSAAAFHGFTTQKPATVFVAVKRQTPARTIEGAEIRFVSVELRKFFGSKRYTVYGRNILISDPEKTVTDCIDRPDLAGGPAELTRIVHAAMAKIDPDKLVLAAVQMRSTSRNTIRPGLKISVRKKLGSENFSENFSRKIVCPEICLSERKILTMKRDSGTNRYPLQVC